MVDPFLAVTQTRVGNGVARKEVNLAAPLSGTVVTTIEMIAVGVGPLDSVAEWEWIWSALGPSLKRSAGATRTITVAAARHAIVFATHATRSHRRSMI